ncbi:putative membrane protein [Sulfurospirillum multivorans]|nr:putative membrane protein [Sulfurospirillum multivorans]
MNANKPALLTYGVGSLVTFIISFIFYLKIEALEYASILEKISFAIPGIICFAIGAFFLICFVNLLFKTLIPRKEEKDDDDNE